MLGQGIKPQDDHPLADSLSAAQLIDKLDNTKKAKMEPLPMMPSHDQFLEMFCKA